MAEARQRLVAGWLLKAEEDLAVAKLLILVEQRLLGAGAYHCQQAAEKSLKAFLTHHDRVFPRTHDLEVLVALCTGIAPGFEQWKEAARILTPVVTEFRYPGDRLEPALPEARQLWEHAQALCAYISSAMPAVEDGPGR